jgi:hypothetical protein
MSMEHKAFVFDYNEFQEKLAGLLSEALKNDVVNKLREFITENLDLLKDPYEGEPLDDDWETMIDPKDAHQYGDFALTMFYEPINDIGLGYDWDEISNILNNNITSETSPILGTPLGLQNDFFDPGKMGSYFQSPTVVNDNLQLLKKLNTENSINHPKLRTAIEMLEQPASSKKGLYVTF